MIALALLKLAPVARLAVSARATFEALVESFVSQPTKQIKFDANHVEGVLDRGKDGKNQALIVVDPTNNRSNLTGKVISINSTW